MLFSTIRKDYSLIDKFSECQYNMSFHVQKWPDILNCWSDIQSKKEAKKRNKKKEGKNDGKKKGGEKTMV